MRVKLGVVERLQLPTILPQEGNFLELTMRSDLLDKTNLTQKEIADWNIVAEGQSVKWDDKKAKEVDFEITGGELEYVRKHIEKLNNENKLTMNTFSLYEKFVVQKEDKK